MALLHLAMEAAAAAAAAAGWLYVKETIVEGGTLMVSIVFCIPIVLESAAEDT